MCAADAINSVSNLQLGIIDIGKGLIACPSVV